MLKQASDEEYAFIYYELFVQVKGGLQYYAVHVNIRLVCAAEGGVRSKCYMYGTVYLFILEYQSGQPGGGIGTYAKLSHVVGVAKGVDPEIIEGLRANFNGECSEVGMYLAMARVAHREGYPEIGLYWEKAAYEEAEHAAKFAELLGEVVTDSTKRNLEMRVEAEHGATEGKTMLAKRAKELNLDAIHDTVHEMARDEARHGKAFEGLLKRYFGE